jgi:hypothetical protein
VLPTIQIASSSQFTWALEALRNKSTTRPNSSGQRCRQSKRYFDRKHSNLCGSHAGSARQLPPVQSISAASVQQRQPTPLTAPCSKWMEDKSLPLLPVLAAYTLCIESVGWRTRTRQGLPMPTVTLFCTSHITHAHHFRPLCVNSKCVRESTTHLCPEITHSLPQNKGFKKIMTHSHFWVFAQNFKADFFLFFEGIL